jgi:hypothetical protein
LSVIVRDLQTEIATVEKPETFIELARFRIKQARSRSGDGEEQRLH